MNISYILSCDRSLTMLNLIILYWRPINIKIVKLILLNLLSLLISMNYREPKKRGVKTNGIVYFRTEFGSTIYQYFINIFFISLFVRNFSFKVKSTNHKIFFNRNWRLNSSSKWQSVQTSRIVFVIPNIEPNLI